MKALIGRLFHVSYTVAGMWWSLRGNGWACQQSARRAIERDDDAVELWKREVWPQEVRSRSGSAASARRCPCRR
ncbi:winged helix-turn-helix domain-containing protein [Streptomyces sp. NBC_00654]|uniref:helix-turn-helix domain-containing protein n=1 Tax=Streptomyces sp. NBC_00654 TaxID=2975799 RepID=UPI002259670D|nr:winged helix-turn-helix domain-containing protein [Streptomyces sp. NBC_00654]MCX4966443.1 winged helix-turn-helix domain-containing protein [Streptomyces sp. NBC_00654]